MPLCPGTPGLKDPYPLQLLPRPKTRVTIIRVIFVFLLGQAASMIQVNYDCGACVAHPRHCPARAPPGGAATGESSVGPGRHLRAPRGSGRRRPRLRAHSTSRSRQGPRSPAPAPRGLPLITITRSSHAFLLIKHCLRVMPSFRQ